METLKHMSFWGRRRAEKETNENMWCINYVEKENVTIVGQLNKERESANGCQKSEMGKIGFADRKDTEVTRETRLAVTFCVIFISFCNVLPLLVSMLVFNLKFGGSWNVL